MCELCGLMIFAEIELSQQLQIAKETQTEDERKALVRINEFDMLAARMGQHIAERHKEQAQMAVLVSFSASKVYAATHMQSVTEPDFDRLRTSWRKSLLRDVGVYRDEDDPAAAAAATGAAAEPLGATEA